MYGAGRSRITHPFATLTTKQSLMDPVRLACVKHAASVRPEPGSNSPINLLLESLNGSIIIFSLKEIVFGAENEIRTRAPRLGKAMLYH